MASKRFCRHLRADQARFSLKEGTDPLIARGRARLESVPGAMDLVMSMASFYPAERPTMLEALTHQAFQEFRVGGGGRGEETEVGTGKVLEFVAFARRDGDNKQLLDV